MKPNRTEAQIAIDLDSVALEIAQISCYLEGSLQKSVKRYRKKDGTVSEYQLPLVLQYPKEGGAAKAGCASPYAMWSLSVNCSPQAVAAGSCWPATEPFRLSGRGCRCAETLRKKNATPLTLGPLAASCIGKLHEIFAQAEATQKDLSALDARVLETVRGLGLTSLSAMLSNLGERGPGTLREIGADMVLGHVRFDCRYAALALGKPTSRQDGRRRARETEKGI